MKINAELENPGDLNIEKMTLVSTRNTIIDLDDYFVEFNLFEDIFSPALTGSIVISDNRNLINEMPIVGDELLIIKLTTPTFPSSIEKTFRVTGITDKHIVRGQNSQLYTLNFCSQELVLDMNAPIYKSFEGKVDDLAIEIFEEYVAMSRSLDSSGDKLTETAAGTNLRIITETKNKIKFVSPGWTAFKCLNWLASRAIPKEDKACNFLFWESNKSFYFGTLETIFKGNRRVGEYTYAQSNLRTGPARDILREMFLTDAVETIVNVDRAKNYTSGYLANRLLELDIVNKKYELIDYDHAERFNDYTHMSGTNSIPFFSRDTMRNPACDISFYPKHPKLFYDKEGSAFEENINEVYKDIHGNRKSNLLELENFKLIMHVPGRTDIECGQMITLNYPMVAPTDNSDKLKDKLDPLYSGPYLITAIRHQINGVRHKMIVELTKDSLSGR